MHNMVYGEDIKINQSNVRMDTDDQDQIAQTGDHETIWSKKNRYDKYWKEFVYRLYRSQLFIKLNNNKKLNLQWFCKL